MGLIVTAHPRVELLAISCEAMQRRDWKHPLYDEDGEKSIFLFNIDRYEARSDGVVEGIYRPRGRDFGFYAGCYTGYVEWRATLAEIAGETKAFAELIDFTSCDGFVGPLTSAKLAADFVAHKKAAVDVLGTLAPDGLYRSFGKAFAVASQGGVVEFH